MELPQKIVLGLAQSEELSQQHQQYIQRQHLVNGGFYISEKADQCIVCTFRP